MTDAPGTIRRSPEGDVAVRTGQLIRAIKRHRELTNASLKESKYFIENHPDFRRGGV